MFLEISLVLVSILFVTSCYVIWNLNTKLESLEDWVTDFMNTIEKVNRDLKQADYKGSFESDDEVGFIFKEIKNTIKQLDRFKGEEQ
jgi:hypothetical protein|tara:strand:+ start:440 stop:700 length:261 start_codon:yes stop_codon:yes gene_type:complete